MPVVRGSCLCGGVKYEIMGPLMRSGHCHCSNCRKAHGAAFRSRARVRVEDFRWMQGEELVRYFESSPGSMAGTYRSVDWNNPTRHWIDGRFSGFHREPAGGVVGSAGEGHKFGDHRAPQRGTFFGARTCERDCGTHARNLTRSVRARSPPPLRPSPIAGDPRRRIDLLLWHGGG